MSTMMLATTTKVEASSTKAMIVGRSPLATAEDRVLTEPADSEHVLHHDHAAEECTDVDAKL